MGGREGVHIINLTAGSGTAVKRVAIPGSDALLIKAGFESLFGGCHLVPGGGPGFSLWFGGAGSQ